MDTTRRSLGLMTAGAVAAVALGNSTPVLATPADQAAITANIETFREAFLKQDLAKLADLVTDTVNYGHSSGVVENKQQFLDAVKARKAVMKSLAFTNVKVDVTGGSAIARHTWESVSELEGKTTNTKIGVLQVWQKGADGKWKIYGRQAFRLPT